VPNPHIQRTARLWGTAWRRKHWKSDSLTSANIPVLIFREWKWGLKQVL